jgi:membrane associated rhomboid family serine protease
MLEKLVYDSVADNIMQYSVLLASLLVVFMFEFREIAAYVSLIAFIVIQISVWYFLSALGISLIWSGLLGYALMHGYKNHRIPSQSYLAAGIFIIGNLCSWKYIGASAGLTLFAHIVGFVAGMPFALILFKTKKTDDAK